MRILEGLTVSDKILNILLLQVVPGYEEKVANEFANDCDAYIGLGRYDVVLLKEEAGSSFLDEKRSFLRMMRRRIPNTSLDWMTICGIKYKDQKKTDREVQRRSVMGICCIKLAPNQKTRMLEVEERVVKNIYNEVGCAVVYAGLGYNEVICIVESESLESLAEELQKIKLSLVNEKSQTENSILDITTIPCIRVSCLGRANSVKGKSTATIILALRAHLPSKVFEIVANLLNGKVRNVFGFHDGIVTTSLPTSTLLSNLLKMRKQTRRLGLYSTYTLVELGDAFSTQPNNAETQRRTSLKWRLDLSRDKSLEKMIAEDEEIPEDLVYYFNVFRSLKIDPFTSDLFRNLNPFINAQIRELKQARLSQDPRDYRQKTKDYSTVLDSLKLALHQRLTGLEVGNLLGIKSANFDSMGGVHRMIFALESIPLRLLQQFGVDWDGFCIFEHRESIHTCIPSGVLMAPRRILLKPDELCSVFHEAGHVAFIKLLELDKTVSSKILSFCRDRSLPKISSPKTTTEDEEGERRRKTLYEEFFKLSSDVFSDMFAYAFGFKYDWGKYSQGLWKRLVELGLVNYKYIARSCLVYTTMRPMSEFSTDASFDAFCSEFKQAMSKNNVQISNQTMQDAKKMVDIFKETAQCLAFAVKTRFGEVNYKDTDSGKIRDSLSQGIPVAGVDPAKIICAIGEIDLAPRTKFAAILSLYGEGQRSL